MAVLEDFLLASQALLLKGFRVNITGLVDLFPRIKGIFTGPLDDFDPSRHRVDLGANPGALLRTIVREQGTVSKDEAIIPVPNLLRDVRRPGDARACGGTER